MKQGMREGSREDMGPTEVVPEDPTEGGGMVQRGVAR